MARTDLNTFLNALRILRCIDRPELQDAGIKLDDMSWRRFRSNPVEWLVTSSDQAAEAIWTIIEKRQPKARTDG